MKNHTFHAHADLQDWRECVKCGVWRAPIGRDIDGHTFIRCSLRATGEGYNRPATNDCDFETVRGILEI